MPEARREDAGVRGPPYQRKVSPALVHLTEHAWAEPAGPALVGALTLGGSGAEARPDHHYGGPHREQHPAPWAFALLVVPVVALRWRRTHPLVVFAVAVAAVAGWPAGGQVCGAAFVVVLVALTTSEVARVMLVLLAAGGTALIWLVEGVLGPWGWWGGRSSACGPKWRQLGRSALRSPRAGSGGRASRATGSSAPRRGARGRAATTGRLGTAAGPA